MKLLQTPWKVPYFGKYCPLNKKVPAEGLAINILTKAPAFEKEQNSHLFNMSIYIAVLSGVRVSFLIELQASLSTTLKKETLAQGFSWMCFPVIRTPFLQNTSGRLLLQLEPIYEINWLITSWGEHCCLWNSPWSSWILIWIVQSPLMSIIVLYSMSLIHYASEYILLFLLLLLFHLFL